MQDKHIASHDALNAAFDDGAIFNASQDDLKRYLRCLGTLNISNYEVRTKAVVRALTINHIQMSATIQTLESTIKKLNAENKEVSRWVMILTFIGVFVALMQLAILLKDIYHSN